MTRGAADEGKDFEERKKSVAQFVKALEEREVEVKREETAEPLKSEAKMERRTDEVSLILSRGNAENQVVFIPG